MISEENSYLMAELMKKENLSSVKEINANEKVIYATSKEHGPVTYQYRVVHDQAVANNEKVVGGEAGHNMIAFKQVHLKRKE